MRPTSIIRFERIYLVSIVISVVQTALSFDANRAELARDPTSIQLGLGGGFLAATMAVGVGLVLLLWFFVAHRASNVAKWILVPFTALGLLMTIASFANGSAGGGIQMILMLSSTALEIAALYFLFQRDARDWLASKGRVGAVDPTVFD
ncbi:MAG TPA: hypothetical protein VHG29_03330 [Novosphingobium sp.]|nr:hypothetical protein [Novosphingobium sp.]